MRVTHPKLVQLQLLLIQCCLLLLHLLLQMPPLLLLDRQLLRLLHLQLLLLRLLIVPRSSLNVHGGNAGRQLLPANDMEQKSPAAATLSLCISPLV